MRLLLVCHGETPWNREDRIMGRSDLSLSPQGRIQAEALALALAKVDHVEAIYSSPLARARETAGAISDALDVPVHILDGLIERDVGPLESLSQAEAERRYSEFTERWKQDPANALLSGVESLAHLQERAWDSIAGLLKADKDETVVVVSHFFPILLLLCRFLDLPISKYRGLRVDLASVSTVHVQDGSMRLLALNDRCHPSGEQRPVEIPSL